MLFVYSEGENLGVYPFLLNKINEPTLDKVYYDIQSAYGYGGPLVNSCDEEFLESFERAFIRYCEEENIIAEFIRFHPLIKNESVFKKHIDISHNRCVSYAFLKEDIEDIFKYDITSKNRNMIRKAEKNLLKVDFKEDMSSFKDIYEKTMKKVNANKYYYFSDKFYEYLNELDKVFINITLNNKLIASSIFLKGQEYIHYYLSGSLKEYLKFAPNNLMLWSAIKYAKDNGFKIIHFGGGLEDSKEDNLFKFKREFGKEIGDFYIGKRIHNKEVYDYLIDKWENENESTHTLFLQYRN